MLQAAEMPTRVLSSHVLACGHVVSTGPFLEVPAPPSPVPAPPTGPHVLLEPTSRFLKVRRTEQGPQGMKCWLRWAPQGGRKLNQRHGDLVLGRASKQPSW